MQTPALLADCFSGVRIGGGTLERSFGRQLLAHTEYLSNRHFLSRVFLNYFFGSLTALRHATPGFRLSVRAVLPLRRLPSFHSPPRLVYSVASHHTSCGSLLSSAFPQASILPCVSPIILERWVSRPVLLPLSSHLECTPTPVWPRSALHPIISVRVTSRG